MKEFNISDSSYLPKIDSQDPMAKWIGARPSDVIEVVGLCESSGLNRRYRLCVADVANA
jgi:DNA-directed RNA polymerase subunit H (RpoH/RPB5)